MYTIMLVDMPFSDVARPSIALTQLKSVLRSKFAQQLSVDIIYLGHDFVQLLGLEFYNYLSDSLESLKSGLGDWFFKQEAFPDLPDNADAYFRRYFPKAGEARRIREAVDQTRSSIGLFMERLISVYKLDKADIVGFSSMFMQNTSSFALARKLKQRNPQVITVMGGANCEFPMGEVIAKYIKHIDFTFSGPALKSFPEFVQHCMSGDFSKCHSIRGVFSKHSLPKCGIETIGEDVPIDSLVELDYDRFISRLSRYFPGGCVNPVLPFETSRGCWWGQRAHCTFCGLNGSSMTSRVMKPELAILHIKSLFRYSGKASELVAVDNILPQSYLQDVLPALETPTNMRIFFEVKAPLSEEDISVLAKARVKRIQPGIESLASSTLKLMRKGTTAFQNLQLLQWCACYKIHPIWNLLVGFPGEVDETYRRYSRILPFLFHLPPPTGIHAVRFDRFSPYHSHPESYGLQLQPADFYALIYPFNEVERMNFAYYFTDQSKNAEYAATLAKWFDPLRTQVDAWISGWNGSRQVFPRLHFSGDSKNVYDSRSGKVVEHPLSEIHRTVLRRLSKPTNYQSVVRELFASVGCDVSGDIESLEEKGLIFREGDHLSSLVLDQVVEGPE